MFANSHKVFTNFAKTPHSLNDSFSAIKQTFTSYSDNEHYIDTHNSVFTDKYSSTQSITIDKTPNKTNSLDNDTKSNNNNSQSEISMLQDVNVSLSGSLEVEESKEAFYTIHLDMPLNEDLTLHIETSHSTTQDEDYIPLYQTVTILTGETSVDFSVETLADTLNEGKEDYLVTMSIDTYSRNYNFILTNDTVTTTIIDECNTDIDATLSLSGDTSTLEGEDAMYTLSLDNIALQSMTIQVKVSNITTDGDIVEEILDLVIEKNQTEINFSISNLNDAVYEETQEYRVEIINNSNAGYQKIAIGNREVITAIIDDDTDNNAPIANDDDTACIVCSNELVSDTFDENDGWGCNVFNGNLVLWAMDNSASKTFDFGIENAGKTVLIAIEARSGGLANPIHSQEDTFFINGTEMSLTQGEEAKLFSVEAIVDENGNVEVEFARIFCDGIIQDVILDNLSITALGNDWDCNQITLVDGFKDDDCPLILDNPLIHDNSLICDLTSPIREVVGNIVPNILDNDVTLSLLNTSESNSFDLGLENAGKNITVSFEASGLSMGGLLNISNEIFYINGQEMIIEKDCKAQTFTLDLLVDAEGKVDIEFSRPKSTIDAHIGGSLDLGVDAELTHLCELIVINNFKILGSLDEWGCGPITTDENTPVMVAVLNNDTDPDNDIITITHIQGQDATNGESVNIVNAGVLLGSAKIVGDEIEFTPDETLKELESGDTQEVIFEYTISDEFGASDSANVTIEVTGLSDESSTELPGDCLDLSLCELCLEIPATIIEIPKTVLQNVEIAQVEIQEETMLSLGSILITEQEDIMQTQSNTIFESSVDDFSDFTIGNLELIVDENAQNCWS